MEGDNMQGETDRWNTTCWLFLSVWQKDKNIFSSLNPLLAQNEVLMVWINP